MPYTRNFFFFQAEDGIRDATVTGVQTCALPIWDRELPLPRQLQFPIPLWMRPFEIHRRSKPSSWQEVVSGVWKLSSNTSKASRMLDLVMPEEKVRPLTKRSAPGIQVTLNPSRLLMIHQR